MVSEAPIGGATLTLYSFSKIAGDLRVVGRRPRERAHGQPATRLRRRFARRGDLIGHLRVVRRVGHDRHALMIFGRAAQHRRPADVHVLNRVRQRHIRSGNGLLEWVQIHDHQIDGLDVMFAGSRLMGRVVPQIEQAAVDSRMKRFDPAVHHFRKPCVCAQIADHDAVLPQDFGRPAGGNNLNSRRQKRLRERDKTRLVVDGDDCAFNFRHTRRKL